MTSVNKKIKTVKGSTQATSEFWMQGKRGYYSSVDDYSFTDMLYNYNPKEYAGTYHTGGITSQEGYARVLKKEMIIPPDVTELLLNAAQNKAGNVSNAYGPSVFSPTVIFDNNRFESSVDVEGAVHKVLNEQKDEMIMNNRAYQRPFR